MRVELCCQVGVLVPHEFLSQPLRNPFFSKPGGEGVAQREEIGLPANFVQPRNPGPRQILPKRLEDLRADRKYLLARCALSSLAAELRRQGRMERNYGVSLVLRRGGPGQEIWTL